MTQGFEANHSGQFLENIVHREFLARGYIFRAHSDDGGNLDMFSPRVVVTLNTGRLMIRIYHYVPRYQALDWLRLGWIIAKPNCKMYMDEFSVTMEWLCDCKLVRPQ